MTESKSSPVAFLGLGVMGGPMARHLAGAGRQVTVYNRTPAKALAWVAQNGGQAKPTPAEAAEGAEFVMMCVGNDDDVRSVALGSNGALAGILVGGLTVILWKQGAGLGGIFALYELVPGFVLSMLAIVVVSRLDRNSATMPA